jgi:hypothetical protein
LDRKTFFWQSLEKVFDQNRFVANFSISKEPAHYS